MSRKSKKTPQPFSLASGKGFRQAMRMLEEAPYFEYSSEQRAAIAALEQACGKIEAWSFIIHPAILEALQPDPPRVRHVIIIDTLRSKAYWPIRSYLESVRINVNSYFSGGWADFVCDGYFTETTLQEFLGGLTERLKEGGSFQLVPRGAKLITVYRVVQSWILCGRILRNVGNPTADARADVLANRAVFEMAHRDYRDSAVRRSFGNSNRKLGEYLSRLRRENVIMCFEMVYDFAHVSDREYVPLRYPGAGISNLIDRIEESVELGAPIVDLLEVEAIQFTDPTESNVTHLLINHYETPRERQRWKELLYEGAPDDANIYTYPLEGTVNESPFVISDLPDALARAKLYASGLRIGKLEHPLMNATVEVYLPIESLPEHGVTLGNPGTGKTNTDLVLASSAVRVLKSVVFMDASGGVRSKLEALAKSGLSVNTFAVDTAAELAPVLREALQAEGYVLVEVDRQLYPDALGSVVSIIERSPDATTGNVERTLEHLLVIEEADDALGRDDRRSERLGSLEGLLNKAYRKGWCIWVSTQSALHLGENEEARLRLLSLLKNRFLHTLDRGSVDLLETLFHSEMSENGGRQFWQRELRNIPSHTALIRGAVRLPSESRLLRPILTRVDVLRSDKS